MTAFSRGRPLLAEEGEAGPCSHPRQPSFTITADAERKLDQAK